MDGKLQEARVTQIMLADDGTFANNPMLPLLLYSGVFLPCGADPASEVEARFDANGWPAAWRNGIYACHHYHSEAHEALGVYRGSAEVQFGGPNGSVVQIAASVPICVTASGASGRARTSAWRGCLFPAATRFSVRKADC